MKIPCGRSSIDGDNRTNYDDRRLRDGNYLYLETVRRLNYFQAPVVTNINDSERCMYRMVDNCVVEEVTAEEKWKPIRR